MGTRARSPQIEGLLQLWAAHRELTALEWLECQETLTAAASWLWCAAVTSLVAWLALNAAVLMALRGRPELAALTLFALNLTFAGAATWRAVKLLRRPLFALTRREAGRDVSSLLGVSR